MTVLLSPVGGVAGQFFDNNGNPLTGGKLYTYVAGTTTPQATYTTSAGSTAHANPIVLDSAGRVPSGEIWITASQVYKFALYTSANVLIGTYDNITGINGTGIATDAAAVSYTPAGTGAVVTTVQSKFRETVSVFDFMTAAQISGVKANTAGVDVTAAIQAAINTDKQVFFPAGTYTVTSPIFVSGNYFNVYGVEGKTMLEGTGFISTTTSIDLSYPTTTYIGPMSGSCFYYTTQIMYSQMTGMSFSGFKFANAFLEPHNTPQFTRCYAQYCNAFVFCYQGSQNNQYDSMRMAAGGPVHISSATCYPTGSPWAGEDNAMTDGFKFINSQGSLNTGEANTYFDNWFRDSILRPTVGSTVVDATDYIYPFSASDVVSKASGWALAYVPFRNQKTMFNPTIRDIDIRYGQSYGTACFNGRIIGGEITGYTYEDQTGTPSYQFAIGSVVSLTVNHVSATVSGQPQVPFIRFTGKGYSPGYSEQDNTCVVYINCDVYPPIFQSTGAATTLSFHQTLNRKTANSDSYIAQATGTREYGAIDSRSDGGMQIDFTPIYGLSVSDNRNQVSWNLGLPLPFYDSTNGYWHRWVALQTGYGDCTGLFQMSVNNLTTGETDYGEYYVQLGNTYTLTTSSIISNGSTTIVVTSAPPRNFSRFSQFTVGSTTVTANSFNETTNTITLEGPVSGLASPIAAAATMTKTYFIVPVKPFVRGWAALQFGGFPYSNSADLCLGSVVTTYGTAPTASDQSIYVSGVFTQMKCPNITVSTTVPTTGKWVAGAQIWNSTPAAGGVPGWVCVTAGTPGTWKAMAALAA